MTIILHRMDGDDGLIPPLPNETVWDWAHRQSGQLGYLITGPVLARIWSCIVVKDDQPLPDEESEHIMRWGSFYFFSCTDVMALFKLKYSEYIVSTTIVKRGNHVGNNQQTS